MRAAPVLVLLLALDACGKSGAELPSDAASEVDGAAPVAPIDLTALARAEDQRRARDIPEEARASHDVRVRRRAARALGRIADAASMPGLYRALADEDRETAAWGAFGLGGSCRAGAEPKDDAVGALIARAESDSAASPDSPIELETAIARAVGRCAKVDPAGPPTAAEAWLARRVTRANGGEAAILALGDIAARATRLSDETATLLLDAASGKPGAVPIDVALYPFARTHGGLEAFAARLVSVARAALARHGDARIFAVRALAHAGESAAPELVRIIDDKAFSAPERAEAAGGLRAMGAAGRAAAAEALAALFAQPDPLPLGEIAKGEYGVLRSLLDAVPGEPPKKIEPALRAVAGLSPAAGASASLIRRLAELRCTAASLLARGLLDAEPLRKCDTAGSEAWERGRLAALASRKIMGHEGRTAWVALARSAHPRVREAALELASRRGELAEVVRAPLAEALASHQAGLVAVAATELHAHPEEAYVLAASERQAALDPLAPPLGASPRHELDPAVVKALRAALAGPWSEDLVETRIALFDAAVTLGMKEGVEVARAACHDPNVTMRLRGAAALRSAKEDDSGCKAPDDPRLPAPEVGQPAHAAKITLVLDSGEVSLVLDPELAPVTTLRLVSLAKSGFYKGVIVHRVVPSFVVQAGDPEGDGYGGSGTALRCEASPVTFGALDVGMALAGKDTGSSQFFVTLARSPHLDGEFSRIGHAEGDWSAIAEGDEIREVKVED